MLGIEGVVYLYAAAFGGRRDGGFLDAIRAKRVPKALAQVANPLHVRREEMPVDPDDVTLVLGSALLVETPFHLGQGRAPAQPRFVQYDELLGDPGDRPLLDLVLAHVVQRDVERPVEGPS